VTTESSDTSGTAAAARIARGGLALALMMAHASAPAAAQERTSAQELNERLQQIQGQVEPGAAQSVQGQPARPDELIRQIEAIQQPSLGQSTPDQQPALGEDEVRKLVREGLGVDVLSVELVERDGQPVYALTVMNPPGNYNGAFMVRTLLVDGATGGLLGQVPHTPRAAALNLTQDAPAAGFEGSGPEIRRRSHR
jgi:uncharacterized membrane protein YkoI